MSNANLAPNEDKLGVFNTSESRHDEATIFEVVRSVLLQGTGVTLAVNPTTGQITINGSTGPGAATEAAAGIVELATAAEGATGTDPVRVPPVLIVKAMIEAGIADAIDGAPGALDTLNELAQALGDDPNFAATVTTSLAAKANTSTTVTAGAGLVGGGDLSTNRTISSSLGDGSRQVLTAS